MFVDFGNSLQDYVMPMEYRMCVQLVEISAICLALVSILLRIVHDSNLAIVKFVIVFQFDLNRKNSENMIKNTYLLFL